MNVPISYGAGNLLRAMQEWEAEHPDALGWIGMLYGPAFERSFFGELRREGLIHANTTDGHGNPLFCIVGGILDGK